MSGEARERGQRQVGDFLPMVPELEDMQGLGPKAVRGPREQPLQEAFLPFHMRWGELSNWTLGQVCQGVAKDSRDSSFVPKLDG